MTRHTQSVAETMSMVLRDIISHQDWKSAPEWSQANDEKSLWQDDNPDKEPHKM